MTSQLKTSSEKRFFRTKFGDLFVVNAIYVSEEKQMVYGISRNRHTGKTEYGIAITVEEFLDLCTTEIDLSPIREAIIQIEGMKEDENVIPFDPNDW